MVTRKWDILKGDNTGAKAGKSEAGKRPPPPSDFCRSVYPSSTGEADYVPSDF